MKSLMIACLTGTAFANFDEGTAAADWTDNEVPCHNGVIQETANGSKFFGPCNDFPGATSAKVDGVCPTCDIVQTTPSAWGTAKNRMVIRYSSRAPQHDKFDCHYSDAARTSCSCECDNAADGKMIHTRDDNGNERTPTDAGAGPTAMDMVNDSPFGYCTNKNGQVSDANRDWHIYPGRVDNLQQCVNTHNLGSGGVLFNPNIPAPRNNCLLCPTGYGYTTAAADYTGNANSMSTMNEAETGDRSTSDPTLRASWQHVAYPAIWKCSNFEAASCERYDGGYNRYGSRVSVRSDVQHRDQWFDVADQDACSAACAEAVKYNREPLGAGSSRTDYCCAWFPDDGDSRGNCHVRIADDNYAYRGGRRWFDNGDPAVQDNEYHMPTPTYYQDSLAISKFWFCIDNADGYSRDENDICTKNWWGNMYNGYPRACGPGPSDQPYCYWRNTAREVKGMDAFSRAKNMDGDWNIPYGFFGVNCNVRMQPGNKCTPYAEDNWETFIPSHQHNTVGYVDKLRMPSRGAETIKAQSCMSIPLEMQLVFNEGMTWDGVVASALSK